jgi:hypothetical protein
MQVVDQTIEELVESLSPLSVEWMDDVAASAIAKLAAIEIKEAYDRKDIAALLEDNFDEGILCCRLFLALSKDTMEAELRRELGSGGIGVKRYQSDPDGFLAVLERLGLPSSMAAVTNYNHGREPQIGSSSRCVRFPIRCLLPPRSRSSLPWPTKRL